MTMGRRSFSTRRRPVSGRLYAVRIFYMFLPGRRIVLLDGIVKKRDDIPSAVLKRLRQLQREVASKT